MMTERDPSEEVAADIAGTGGETLPSFGERDQSGESTSSDDVEGSGAIRVPLPIVEGRGTVTNPVEPDATPASIEGNIPIRIGVNGEMKAAAASDPGGSGDVTVAPTPAALRIETFPPEVTVSGTAASTLPSLSDSAHETASESSGSPLAVRFAVPEESIVGLMEAATLLKRLHDEIASIIEDGVSDGHRDWLWSIREILTRALEQVDEALSTKRWPPLLPGLLESLELNRQRLERNPATATVAMGIAAVAAQLIS